MFQLRLSLRLAGLVAQKQRQFHSRLPANVVSSSKLSTTFSCSGSPEAIPCNLMPYQLHSHVGAQFHTAASFRCTWNTDEIDVAPNEDEPVAATDAGKTANPCLANRISYVRNAALRPFLFTQKNVESHVLGTLSERIPIPMRLFNHLMEYYIHIDRMNLATELLYLLQSKQGKQWNSVAIEPAVVTNHSDSSDRLRSDLVAAIYSLPFIPSPNNTSYSLLLTHYAYRGRTDEARRLILNIRKQEELAQKLSANSKQHSLADNTTPPTDAASTEATHPPIRVISHYIMLWIHACNRRALKQTLRDARMNQHRYPFALASARSMGISTAAGKCYVTVRTIIRHANEWNIPLNHAIYQALIRSASMAGNIDEAEWWAQQLADYDSQRTDSINQVNASRFRVIASAHLYVASMLDHISSSRAGGNSPSSLHSITPSAKCQTYYDEIISGLHEYITLSSTTLASPENPWNELRQDEAFFIQLQELYIKRIMPIFSHLSHVGFFHSSLQHLEKMADEFTAKHSGNLQEQRQTVFSLRIALYDFAIATCELNLQAYAAVSFFSTFIHREVNLNHAETHEDIYRNLLRVLMVARDWSSCVGVLDRIDTVDTHVKLSEAVWLELAPLLPQVRDQQVMAATVFSKTSRSSQANVMQDLVNAEALFQEWTKPATPQTGNGAPAKQRLRRSRSPATANVPPLTVGATVVDELRKYLQELLPPPQ